MPDLRLIEREEVLHLYHVMLRLFACRQKKIFIRRLFPMRRIRQIISASLLALVTALPAQAATWRYSFDVVDSQILFGDLYKYALIPGGYDINPVTMTESELDYVYNTYHPLGHLRGFTGPTVWDVTADEL